MGMAPARRAKELPEQIKKVGTEVDEKLVTAMFAAHAIDARQPRFANLACADQRDRDPLNRGMAAPGMGDNQTQIVFRAGRHHLINLSRGSGGRFFQVDVCTVFSRGQHHRQMITDLTAGDYSDVGLLDA